MRYKVRFLDDETFESLPGKDMSTKLGVAYPETMEAYVRKTGIDTLDIFNMAHELEHLDGATHGEHYDSENKCYYKGFGQVLQTIAPIALGFALPGVGGALGGALSGIGGGIASGLGAISPALGGAAQSIGGAIGGAGKAIGGALGMGGGGASPSAGSTGGVDILKQSMGPTGLDRLRGGGASMIMGNGARSATTFGGGGGLAALGGSVGSGLMDNFGKGMMSTAANNLGTSIFGSQNMMDKFQMPQEMGSYQPNIQNNPNMIPGSSGVGMRGGPAGAVGPVGGQAKRIKSYMEGK